MTHTPMTLTPPALAGPRHPIMHHSTRIDPAWPLPMAKSLGRRSDFGLEFDRVKAVGHALHQ